MSNEEGEETNIVKVASRDYSAYISTIVFKMQKFDEIKIMCKPTYINKADYLVQLFVNCGLHPIKGFPLRYEEIQEEVSNPKLDSIRLEKVKCITLRKIPELFKYTGEG